VYKYTDVASDSTTIRVKRETWSTLHELRDPGQSFNDLIEELLDDDDAGE
jgi:predicted CopG family antitoxin